MSTIFIFTLLAFVCLAALFYPHIGVIGYLGFVLLMPEWNWRWVLPQDFQYQKYIAVATLLGCLLNGFRGNSFSGGAGLACASLVSFLGLAYISSMSSINPVSSAWYMDYLWKIVLMALLTFRLINTPGRLTACLWVVTLAQGYNAFRINEQYFQDGISLYAHQTWGYSGDNNLYSNLTVPLIAVSGALVIYSTRLWQKCIAGGIFLLQIHQIMLMESRGAMLGCLAMFAIFVYFMPKNSFTIGAVVLALFAGTALAGPPVLREFTSSFKGQSERDNSAESRFRLWKAGASITSDYPFLGVGPFAGQYLVAQYSGFSNGNQKGLHNLFFEISTGCGIPATILYLAYFVIPCVIAFRLLWSRIWQPPDWAAMTFLSVAAGISGYWISSMFSSGALMESSYSLAALGLAANSILRRMPSDDFDGDDGFEDEYDDGYTENENLMAYVD